MDTQNGLYERIRQLEVKLIEEKSRTNTAITLLLLEAVLSVSVILYLLWR